MMMNKTPVICTLVATLIAMAAFYGYRLDNHPASAGNSAPSPDAVKHASGETSYGFPADSKPAYAGPASMTGSDLRVWVVDVVSGQDTKGHHNYKLLIHVRNSGKKMAVVNYELLERTVAEIVLVETQSGKSWGPLSPFPADPRKSAYSIQIPPEKMLTLAFPMPDFSFFSTPREPVTIEFKHPTLNEGLSSKFIVSGKDEDFLFKRLP